MRLLCRLDTHWPGISRFRLACLAPNGTHRHKQIDARIGCNNAVEGRTKIAERTGPEPASSGSDQRDTLFDPCVGSADKQTTCTMLFPPLNLSHLYPKVPFVPAYRADLAPAAFSRIFHRLVLGAQ
ncbi:hypothetical protein HPB48_016948 [Haemaphysalis longicornis]|uniref:Uncharacterized protein n=1 Tax=Haemaphysalis longicornis TaxID=44386 RepID=A0A9J6G398_HAELO|nr:hypothetical protein HPB48_016948 [Haemaphysalis longicornis]